MTDKQIIYDCPHISFTDWGTYACKLYDPRDKNCLVKGGNCDSNISCPYKQLERKEQRIVEFNKTIQAKEQECERLKLDLIEAKAHSDYLNNLALSETLNLVSEQLDQLKEQLEAYKMEAEEGKEINAELKSDNKHLNGLLDQALKELEELQNLKDEDSLRVVILARENEQLKNRINDLVCSANCYKYKEAQSYKQALEKMRELCQKDKDFCVSCEGDGNIDCIDCTEGGKAKLAIQILQICDEVNDETTNN